MNPAHEPEHFDPQTVADAIAGTWSYPSKHEPSGIGYVHFTRDGKTFCPSYEPSWPGDLIPVRFWSLVETASSIRAQPFKSKGWLVNYSFNGTTLRTFREIHDLTYQRVSEEAIPDWFREALAKALAKPWPSPDATGL